MCIDGWASNHPNCPNRKNASCAIPARCPPTPPFLVPVHVHCPLSPLRLSFFSSALLDRSCFFFLQRPPRTCRRAGPCLLRSVRGNCQLQQPSVRPATRLVWPWRSLAERLEVARSAVAVVDAVKCIFSSLPRANCQPYLSTAAASSFQRLQHGIAARRIASHCMALRCATSRRMLLRCRRSLRLPFRAEHAGQAAAASRALSWMILEYMC